ncbi:hypothetical protein FRB90_011433 [Tulasnella sp. 427]|nr:hypothetical protein FRB90_011433 [Tulasnella sp. 427]
MQPPYHYRPPYQPLTGEGQSSGDSEGVSNGAGYRRQEPGRSDALRQQRLFAYQPSLLGHDPLRLPAPSYPVPRSHPSIPNAPLVFQSASHSRPRPHECTPAAQYPGSLPLRVSDALNRAPLPSRDASPRMSFAITPPVPLGDVWSNQSQPMGRLGSIQPVQHPSTLPLPIQTEVNTQLPPLYSESLAISTLGDSSSMQLTARCPGPDRPEATLGSPYATPFSTFPAAPTRPPRRPRREILAGIKHMVFTWRLNAHVAHRQRPPPVADDGNPETPVPPRTPAFLFPTMPAPLLCTFRLAGTSPTIDSHLELVRENEEGPNLGFPIQPFVRDQDPRMVCTDGIQWLVEPSDAFPKLKSVPTVPVQDAPRPVIKLEEDASSVTLADEGGAASILPPLHGLLQPAGLLPSLAALASPSLPLTPEPAAIDLVPQRSGHVYLPGIPVLPPPAQYPTDHVFHSHVPRSLESPLPGPSRETGSYHLENQYQRPITSNETVPRIVQPPQARPVNPVNNGQPDVLLSKNLWNVLMASVAAPAPKKYVCEICSKSFERRASLETHMTVHNGQRPFKCPVPRCNRDFSVRSNYRRHLRTHRLDPRIVDRAPASRKPESSPYGERSRKRRAIEYSDDDSDREDGAAGSFHYAGASSGGSGEQPGGWGYGAPPSTSISSERPWIPESLRRFNNAHLLSDKPPFDLAGCGPTPSMPLPPVYPWGSPTEPSFEERNSYDSNVPETPYHPDQVMGLSSSPTRTRDYSGS